MAFPLLSRHAMLTNFTRWSLCLPTLLWVHSPIAVQAESGPEVYLASPAEAPKSCRGEGDFVIAYRWDDTNGGSHLVTASQASDDRAFTSRIEVTWCSRTSWDQLYVVVRRFKDRFDCPDGEGDFFGMSFFADAFEIADVNKDGEPEAWFAYLGGGCPTDVSPHNVSYVALERTRKHVAKGWFSHTMHDFTPLRSVRVSHLSNTKSIARWPDKLRKTMLDRWQRLFGYVNPYRNGNGDFVSGNGRHSIQINDVFANGKLSWRINRHTCPTVMGITNEGWVACAKSSAELARPDQVAVSYIQKDAVTRLTLGDLLPQHTAKSGSWFEFVDLFLEGSYLALGDQVTHYRIQKPGNRQPTSFTHLEDATDAWRFDVEARRLQPLD